jgi:hypothetical protein
MHRLPGLRDEGVHREALQYGEFVPRRQVHYSRQMASGAAMLVRYALFKEGSSWNGYIVMTAARVLISREEAARFCGVSLNTFDRHVRPHVLTKMIGRRVLVEEGSVREWAGQRKGGSSSGAGASAMRDLPTPSASTLSAGPTTPLLKEGDRRGLNPRHLEPHLPDMTPSDFAAVAAAAEDIDWTALAQIVDWAGRQPTDEKSAVTRGASGTWDDSVDDGEPPKQAGAHGRDGTDLESDASGYRDYGYLAAVDPPYARGMQCDACKVKWIGCWDNFQCPECGEGELPKPSGEGAERASKVSADPREGNPEGRLGGSVGGLSASPELSAGCSCTDDLCAFCLETLGAHFLNSLAFRELQANAATRFAHLPDLATGLSGAVGEMCASVGETATHQSSPDPRQPRCRTGTGSGLQDTPVSSGAAFLWSPRAAPYVEALLFAGAP